MKKTIPTIAIIGHGNIGSVVAANFVKNNRRVIIAGRDFTKAKIVADKLGPLAQPLDLAAAIKEADIIVMAVWFDAIKELLYKYEGILQGKIIVDPSNPIAPDGKGGFVKTIGQHESAGQLNAALLPAGAKLAKAMGTLGAASLANAANQKPEQAVLFYATDDKTINETVEALITDTGFEPLRVGGIDQSIRLEVFGELHEYGALGKTVTVEEAKQQLASNSLQEAQ